MCKAVGSKESFYKFLNKNKEEAATFKLLNHQKRGRIINTSRL